MKQIISLLKNNQVNAITPHYDVVYSSIVHTHQGNYYYEEYSEKLMDQICTYFGSTLEGRKSATRQKLKFRKNPPFIISEILRLGAFEIPDGCEQPSFIFNFQFELEKLDNGSHLIYAGQEPIFTPLSDKVIYNRKQKAITMMHDFIHVHTNS